MKSITEVLMRLLVVYFMFIRPKANFLHDQLHINSKLKNNFPEFMRITVRFRYINASSICV